ncbi:hypothetical protein ACVWW4_003699 [Bradyrhizobium sp. LB7.1]
MSMSPNVPDRPTKQPAPSKFGGVILIPKQLRAEWMDVMALDARVSHSAFRVAGVIGSHFNRHTGQTFLTHETIARVMGVSERTVFAAVEELEGLGFLLVKRRVFGTITRKLKGGGETQVRVAGGKGVANTYLPAFERSQVAATNSGLKLANRCDLLWELRSQRVATFSEPKVATDCDLWEDQRSQSVASKVATDCDPTLSSSSKKNPSRAREPSSADALGPLAAIIVHARGEAEFEAWFGLAMIAAETPDCLTISLPTRFILSEVGKRYGDKLLSWLQLVDQAKQRVELVLRAAATAPPAGGTLAEIEPGSPKSSSAPTAKRGAFRESKEEPGAAQNVTRLGELMMRRARGSPS